MTLQDAIRTLDDVIPSPDNKKVDAAHYNIALAWQIIKSHLQAK